MIYWQSFYIWVAISVQGLYDQKVEVLINEITENYSEIIRNSYRYLEVPNRY